MIKNSVCFFVVAYSLLFCRPFGVRNKLFDDINLAAVSCLWEYTYEWAE